MKKLDGIKYCIFLIVFLFSICMIGCGNTESTAENKYEFGTMENMQRKTGRTSFLSLGIVPKTTLIVS